MTRRKLIKAPDPLEAVPPHLPSAQEALQCQESLRVLVTERIRIEARMRKARSGEQSEQHYRTLAPILRQERIIRAFLAPIRRLPEELLAEIFQIFNSTADSAWSLTRVCHHWRVVAFNTPRLWNHVSFDREAVTRMSQGAQRCRTQRELEQALQMSKGAPLMLKLWLSRPKALSKPKLDPKCMITILDNAAYRLRELTIQAPSDNRNIPDSALELFSKPLIHLEKLVIHCDTNIIFCEKLLELVDTTAHKLHQLKLSIISSSSALRLSLWSRLSDVEIDDTAGALILSQCLNVRRLCLLGGPMSTPPGMDIESCTFTNLEELTIRSPFPFLSHASTPNLRTLNVWGVFTSPHSSPSIRLPYLQELAFLSTATIYADSFITPVLQKLQARGYASIPFKILASRFKEENGNITSLDSLDLENVEMASKVLLAILKRNQEIKTLRLCGVTCTLEVIEKLSIVDRNPSTEQYEGLLCPLLSQLVIKFGSREISQTRIQGMLHAIIRARKETDLPLTELRFHRYRRGTAHLYTNLATLPDEKLKENQYDDGDKGLCSNCIGFHP